MRLAKLLCALLLCALALPRISMAEGLKLPARSDEYSAELAKWVLPLATGHTKDATASLLSAEGFEVLAQENFEKAADDPSHTCAYTIAKKEIELDGQTRPMLLVIVRGTQAGEWYSNFDFAPSHSGDTAFAENFLFAAEDVFLGLKGYIDAETNPLVLVSGHSRGAACANLLGRLLNARYGSESVYAYTFATPTTVRGEVEACPNVFNLINPCDPVTMMPLAAWGYARVGADIVLKNDESLAARVREGLGVMAALAPDIPSYYGLKHSLTKAGKDENGLTSFEMMLMIARGLAGTAGATDMNTAGAGAISAESDFAPLLEIVSRLSGGWADNEVLRQHLPQTYLALLNE